MLAEINTTIAKSTCDTPGCTYSGAAFYFRSANAYCGKCMDRLDDDDMPPVPISSARRQAA